MAYLDQETGRGRRSIDPTGDKEHTSPLSNMRTKEMERIRSDPDSCEDSDAAGFFGDWRF